MNIKTDNDPMAELAGLPGEELIRQGLTDVASGTDSIPALLVAVGYPRLRELHPLRQLKDKLCRDPEVRLYGMLAEKYQREAHSQYNALLRRLVTFERAYEGRLWRGRRPAKHRDATVSTVVVP